MPIPKLLEKDGKLYAETGETRIAKAGEPFNRKHAVEIIPERDTQNPYPILEEVVVIPAAEYEQLCENKAKYVELLAGASELVPDPDPRPWPTPGTTTEDTPVSQETVDTTVAASGSPESGQQPPAPAPAPEYLAGEPENG